MLENTTIRLSEAHKKKAREDSMRETGTENISSWIRILIMNWKKK